MARIKKTQDSQAMGLHFTPSQVLSKTRLETPVIPTEDRRHITKVRLGRFSGEQFCRNPKRRAELGLRPIPTMESDLIDDLRA